MWNEMSTAHQDLIEECGFLENVWWAWEAFSSFNDDDLEEPTRAVYYDDMGEHIDTQRYCDEFQGPEYPEWIVTDALDGYPIKPLYTGRLVLVDGDPVPKVFMFKTWNAYQYELFDLMCPPSSLALAGGGRHDVPAEDVRLVQKAKHVDDAARAACMRQMCKSITAVHCRKRQQMIAAHLLATAWPITKYLHKCKEILHEIVLGHVLDSRMHG